MTARAPALAAATGARRKARRSEAVRAGARDAPLDAFRGLAVAGMALVNLQDPFQPGVTALSHAEWTGLTLADLVFPFFVLATGLSVGAVDARRPLPPLSRVLARTAGLFALGVVFNWLMHPTPAIWNVRASGVLQRIAVVYLACALGARAGPGWRRPLAVAAGLMAAHALLLLFVAAPGEAAPSLEAGRGLSGWLDRTLLPGRLPRGGYDPEGVLSTLSALATGLLGLAAARRLRERPGELAIWALGLLAAGGAAALWLPVNKQLWTPSFALLTAGVGLGLLMLLHRVPGAAGGAIAPLADLGRRALTFYALHMLLIAGLLRPVGGVRLWDRLDLGLRARGLEPAAANLLLAAALTALCLLTLAPLARRGWELRV